MFNAWLSLNHIDFSFNHSPGVAINYLRFLLTFDDNNQQNKYRLFVCVVRRIKKFLRSLHLIADMGKNNRFISMQ